MIIIEALVSPGLELEIMVCVSLKASLIYWTCFSRNCINSAVVIPFCKP
jgi:hypothetical protein